MDPRIGRRYSDQMRGQMDRGMYSSLQSSSYEQRGRSFENVTELYGGRDREQPSQGVRMTQQYGGPERPSHGVRSTSQYGCPEQPSHGMRVAQQYGGQNRQRDPFSSPYDDPQQQSGSLASPLPRQQSQPTTWQDDAPYQPDQVDSVSSSQQAHSQLETIRQQKALIEQCMAAGGVDRDKADQMRTMYSELSDLEREAQSVLFGAVGQKFPGGDNRQDEAVGPSRSRSDDFMRNPIDQNNRRNKQVTERRLCAGHVDSQTTIQYTEAYDDKPGGLQNQGGYASGEPPLAQSQRGPRPGFQDDRSRYQTGLQRDTPMQLGTSQMQGLNEQVAARHPSFQDDRSRYQTGLQRDTPMQLGTSQMQGLNEQVAARHPSFQDDRSRYQAALPGLLGDTAMQLGASQLQGSRFNQEAPMPASMMSRNSGAMGRSGSFDLGPGFSGNQIRQPSRPGFADQMQTHGNTQQGNLAGRQLFDYGRAGMQGGSAGQVGLDVGRRLNTSQAFLSPQLGYASGGLSLGSNQVGRKRRNENRALSESPKQGGKFRRLSGSGNSPGQQKWQNQQQQQRNQGGNRWDIKQGAHLPSFGSAMVTTQGNAATYLGPERPPKIFFPFLQKRPKTVAYKLKFEVFTLDRQTYHCALCDKDFGSAKAASNHQHSHSHVAVRNSMKAMKLRQIASKKEEPPKAKTNKPPRNDSKKKSTRIHAQTRKEERSTEIEKWNYYRKKILENPEIEEMPLEERMKKVYGTEFCLVCFMPKDMIPELRDHKELPKHKSTMTLYTETLKLCQVIDELGKPETVDSALKTAKTLEERLNIEMREISKGGTLECLICTIDIVKTTVTSKTVGKHKLSLRHVAMKSMLELTVKTKKAFETNDMSILKEIIEDREEMLKFKASGENQWFCYICEQQCNKKDEFEIHAGRTTHLARKVCYQAIIKNIRRVYDLKVGVSEKETESKDVEKMDASESVTVATSGKDGAEETTAESGTDVKASDEGVPMIERTAGAEEGMKCEASGGGDRTKEEPKWVIDKEPMLPDVLEDKIKEVKADAKEKADDVKMTDEEGNRGDDDEAEESDGFDLGSEDEETASNPESENGREKGKFGETPLGQNVIVPAYYCLVCEVLVKDPDVAYGEHCRTQLHCRKSSEHGKAVKDKNPTVLKDFATSSPSAKKAF